MHWIIAQIVETAFHWLQCSITRNMEVGCGKRRRICGMKFK